VKIDIYLSKLMSSSGDSPSDSSSGRIFSLISIEVRFRYTGARL